MDEAGTLAARRQHQLEGWFPHPCRRIIAAAGRLSPEKGFGILVDAAHEVVRQDAGVGFVLFYGWGSHNLTD